MSELGKQSGEKIVKKRPGGLTGRFDRILDPKKRLTVPSAWRDTLGPDYVYVIPDSQDKCLQLVPQDVWDRRMAAVMNGPLSDLERKALARVIGKNSETLEFDTQGRIRISDRLLAHAGIKGPVVMEGALETATIWSAEMCPPETAVDAEALQAAMAKLGF